MLKIAQYQKSLQALDIEADTFKVEKCLAFLEILRQWNQKHNLTRIAKGDQWHLHILDSLSILPYCQGNRILDVGSGAGLPGIPLSIFCQEQKFYLLDSNPKKATFIKYAANKLGLSNVVAIKSLIEQYVPEQKFHTILSRAFASTNKFAISCSHLLDKNGKLIAMKGKVTEEPVGKIPDGFKIDDIISLKVPGVEARHAVIISKLEDI